MDEIAFQREQLNKVLNKRKASLLEVELQKAEFVNPNSVPLDLKRAEVIIREEITRIAMWLEGLETNQSPVEPVDIPFVIVAMTKQEASELIDETVFESLGIGDDSLTRFQQFKILFIEKAVEDWLSCYSEGRESWRPHTCPDNTIREIIFETVTDVNLQQLETTTPRFIRPKFQSEGFFCENKDLRTRTSLELAHTGCVLIVDAVSLFHPGVGEMLTHYEMLSSNPKVAILILSPFNPNVSEISLLVETQVRSRMWHAFSRCDKRFDKSCEIGVGDLRGLKRWLFAILPESAAVAQKPRPNPSIRRLIRQRMGEPVGMDQLIYGQ